MFIVVQCLKFLLFHDGSFVGTGTRPANYPNANQYIEALVKRLTALHCPARIGSSPSPVSLRLDPASSCATKPDPQPAIPQNQELKFTAQALLPLVAGSMTSYRRKVEKRKKMGEYVRQYNPLWTNQTSAAIAKNLKLHPAIGSSLATGTARRP